MSLISVSLRTQKNGTDGEKIAGDGMKLTSPRGKGKKFDVWKESLRMRVFWITDMKRGTME